MFENLGDRLTNVVNKIKGYGKITEDNISDITRELRLALLEADVNYQVVKDGSVTDLKGNITSSGEIALDIGTLSKASSASTTYKIYVWIDEDKVINSDAYSKYYGNIRATAIQTE